MFCFLPLLRTITFICTGKSCATSTMTTWTNREWLWRFRAITFGKSQKSEEIVIKISWANSEKKSINWNNSFEFCDEHRLIVYYKTFGCRCRLSAYDRNEKESSQRTRFIHACDCFDCIVTYSIDVGFSLAFAHRSVWVCVYVCMCECVGRKTTIVASMTSFFLGIRTNSWTSKHVWATYDDDKK